VAQFFELSPDGRYLSIPFDDGRVSVLDIATGEAQLVQPDADTSGDGSGDLKLVTVPTWRTATELTFARRVASSTAQEAVRYSLVDKTTAVISADWPAEIGGWLSKTPPPESSSTAKPAESK